MAPPTTTESSPLYLGDPLCSKNVSCPIRALYHITTYPFAIADFSTQAEANFFSKEYNNVKETIASYNMLLAEKRKEKLRNIWLPMVGEFSNRWSPHMVLVDVCHSTHTVERALGLPLTAWPQYPQFLHKYLIIPSHVDALGVGIL